VAVTEEWRRGWPVVLSAFLGIAASSMPSFALGVMMKPLGAAYGWSRTEITAMITISTIFMLLLSPGVGALADRFGSRRIALGALIYFCLAFAGLSLTGPAIWTWYAGSVLVGIGMALAGNTVWIAPVARQFAKTRALALSVALSGLGLSLAVTPALSLWAMGAVGVDKVYFVLAAFAFLISFPTGLLLFRDAAPRRRDADGQAQDGLTFAEALRTTRFWRLVVAMFIVAATSATLLIHYVPILTDAGVPAARATAYLALLGPASIVGRLICGWLMDRIFAPFVAGGAFFLAVIGYLMLSHYDGSVGMSVLIPCLVGIAGGAEVDVAAYLTARYFGLRSFGSIYGMIQGFNSIFYGMTPTLAAYLYDTTGSYNVMLSILAGALMVSVALVTTLGRYPPLENRPLRAA